MPLYATKRVIDRLKVEFEYAFAEKKYPGVPKVVTYPITGEKNFGAAGLTFTPIQVMHYKLPVLGFRIGNFAYVTDASYIAPKEMDKLRDCHTIILNGLQYEPHISHFTVPQAIAILEELKPKQAFLTHISHRLPPHREASQALPDFIKLAFDELTIHLPD